MSIASLRAAACSLLVFAPLLTLLTPAAGRSSTVSLLSTEAALWGWTIEQRPDGRFTLAWSEGLDAQGATQAWIRRFDATGAPLAPAILVAQTVGIPGAAVAVDAVGNELVVLRWGQGEGEARRYQLRAFGVSASGAELWPSRLLAEITEPHDFIGSVDAVAAPGGGWIVVWEEYHQSATVRPESLSTHVALADGAASPPIALGSTRQSVYSLAVASDGAQPVVVWREEPVANEYRWVARSLDGVGVPTGPVVALAHASGPSLSINGTTISAMEVGNYFVSWSQAEYGSPGDTRGLTYSPGVPASPPVDLVHQVGTEWTLSASVAVDRQGRAMIAWVESPPGSPYPTTVVRQGRSTTGAALSDIVTVADFAGMTGPLVSMTGTGSWMVAWTRPWNPGIPQLAGVNAQFGAFPTDCEANATTLCLTGGRFSATATFHDHLGHDGVGQAVALTPESGTFWFFTAANVELILKVVDACGHPDFQDFWVYASGLTDVEVTLTVVDTWTGEIWERATALGEPFPPVLDSQAFHTCDALPGTGPVAQKEGGI
ncbi:MAG: hypothetical protein QG573_1034 [Acidobacteriota bacterium]|nr:hypothetical protein [Acidobacteriota bacterium]